MIALDQDGVLLPTPGGFVPKPLALPWTWSRTTCADMADFIIAVRDERGKTLLRVDPRAGAGAG